MDKSKNFEREIPDGYVLVKHVNAKDNVKLITIYSILSFIPLLILLPAICLIAYYCSDFNILHAITIENVPALLVTFVLMILYVILHELIHGITYKLYTGGKLTYGLTLTVAFCGVPDLYVRKKASIAALIMPFAVFSIIFGGLTIGLYFVSPLYSILACVLFSIHLGGCVGDLHWILMYMTKFKKCNTLMRDSGPEQWLYIPESEATEYGIAVLQNEQQ